MKVLIFIILHLIIVIPVSAQQTIKGFVGDKNDNETPLVGVNVYWAGTTTGTTTDASGKFVIPLIKESKTLVISHVGYNPDTLIITDQQSVRVMLVPSPKSIDEVDVVAERSATYLDYSSTINKNVITEKELFRAACCNLSESFETNPSIDVTFTDAITGTKQIEMLGLSGIYTQTTLGNMPYIRGLISNIGLTFIPGTWIEVINVSKGIGSVANGYESITGQIDVELRQPQYQEGEKIFLNLYGNQDRRMEANLNIRQPVSENLSSMTLLHFSTQRFGVDGNRDGFLDMPMFTTFNATQLWSYSLPSGWENRLGIQYVNDSKDGGTQGRLAPYSYYYGTKNTLIRLHGKTGYFMTSENGQSVGLQWSISRYKNSAQFGNRLYDAEEKTGYLNIIYQDEFAESKHKYRTGISFLFDQFFEKFDQLLFNRIERTPGIFFEYTYSPNEQLTAVAGIRGDRHNFYGNMISPRLHICYYFNEDWILRLAAGRGFRTANIFAENSTVFASSRAIDIIKENNFGYGLKQEVAWNYGFNLTHYFMLSNRNATIVFDAYRTNFEQLVLADLDASPQQVRFYSMSNGSYSNSAQAEINIQPIERLDMRLAYRYLDVKQKLNGVLQVRPFTAQHRALAVVSYSTEQIQQDDLKTAIDLTIQWFGRKRIPSTRTNPTELRLAEYSPSFFIINSQFTQEFIKGLDVYLGGENILGYRQKNPILDSPNPGSSFFDASLIWGPISGRMVYAGLRYRIQ